jgi:phytoene synthase
MTPDDYCQQRAATSGSSFYYSFRLLPPAQRQAIVALYAFCREVDDIVDECHDTQVARVKLQWWRQELECTFGGRPEHPVSKAIVPALERFQLPREQFMEIIDGMEMDLEQSSYSAYKDLQLYCHRVAGVVGLLSAEIFGYTDRRTLKYAHKLGIAFQLTNILRDVREDALRGRIYLPRNAMDQCGVSSTDIVQGIMSEPVRRLFAFHAKRTREAYQQAFAQLPSVDRYTQRCGLVMGEIYLTLLEEIEKDGYNVLEHKVYLTPLRKLWIAWRTERRERRLRKNAGYAAVG